jgi:hypothetical protein
MDFDDLRKKIIQMLSGDSIKIDADNFTNDMVTFNKSDDVLTLLVHLGYLSYDFYNQTVRIPNQEVQKVFVDTIKELKWTEMINMVQTSDELVKAIWRKDEAFVAKAIQQAHEDNVSLFDYNKENALSCVVSLALVMANEYYTLMREPQSGKGRADLVYIPKKNHPDKPALIIELKWDKSAEVAIKQIKERNYPNALKDYHGNLLLVGINYNATDKNHECIIEQFKID